MPLQGRETPMLTEQLSGPPGTVPAAMHSRAMVRRSRSARRKARGSSPSSQTTANSSPPRRATCPMPPSSALITRATMASTASPTGCPCWSLMALKWSMSIINSTTTAPGTSRQWRSSTSVRPWRLSAPVSASVLAMVLSWALRRVNTIQTSTGVITTAATATRV